MLNKTKQKSKHMTAKLTLTLEKLDELKAILKKRMDDFANSADTDSIDHDQCELDVMLCLENFDSDNYDFLVTEIVPKSYTIGYHGSFWDQI